MAWFKKKPVEPAKPPIALVASTWNDAARDFELRLVCRLCGRKWGRWNQAAEGLGVGCGFCGATARMSQIRAYMRHQLAAAQSNTCIHCYLDETKHADGKCLFQETTYSPRGRVP